MNFPLPPFSPLPKECRLDSMYKVGGILKKAREEKGVSLAQASVATRIQPKFLKALEESDYGAFSSPVYIRGFLLSYTKFLGMDADKILAFWRREYGDSVGSTNRVVGKFLDPYLLPKLVITPAAVFTAGIALLIATFFGYVFWQYHFFAKAPKLAITSPLDGSTVGNYSLNVVGMTEAGAKVSLNGQDIPVTEEGIFAVNVDLAKGINVLSFSAKNKLGRETRTKRTVIVLPKESEVESVAGEATESASPSAGRR